jgi:hypothetical protein
VNLSTMTSRWVWPLGAFWRGPTRSCDRDCVERWSWQMGLPGVELAPFAGVDDPLGVS